jgi:hypothetical protein
MNMEGTKHEKAVLVVLAYIIGFTSGLIAFGLSQRASAPVEEMVSIDMSAPLPTPAEVDGYTPPTENPPDYVETETVFPTEESPVSQSEEGDVVFADGEVVMYQDGKLYANVSGERYVLSLRSDVMPNTNVEGFSTQGIHVALPKYLASPDGQYVYFCEQHTEVDGCTNFVFDIASNTIQFVNNGGEKLITPASIAENAVWSDSGLTIGTYSSISAATPWVVSAN